MITFIWLASFELQGDRKNRLLTFQLWNTVIKFCHYTSLEQEYYFGAFQNFGYRVVTCNRRYFCAVCFVSSFKGIYSRAFT
jgi:hypothetical protein